VASVPAGQVAAVRAFNRFYTKRIGALNEGLLRSPFSLTEMRVLYELAHREGPTAGELADDLGLDAGYLSRILRSFAALGLLARAPSAEDGRRRNLALTEKGRKTFAPYDQRSSEEVKALLAALLPADRRRLVEAMRTIERLLTPAPRAPGRVLLRPARSGELGWIVHRHGALYAEEYGWGEQFESIVARIASDFLARHDPSRERCWVAEIDGELVGSVLLVRKSAAVAKLRLLLVEPSARGLGLGKRLVRECVDFARSAGYAKVVLWTNARLDAARAIYEKTGFRLIRSEPSEIFGPSDTEQSWELILSPLATQPGRAGGGSTTTGTRSPQARRASGRAKRRGA
jgi:DNA-binding MarR family transcriptional regulator/GNAT superfamily N-acetyltransferase